MKYTKNFKMYILQKNISAATKHTYLVDKQKQQEKVKNEKYDIASHNKSYIHIMT